MRSEEGATVGATPTPRVRKVAGVKGDWWYLDGEGSKYEFIVAPVEDWEEIEP